MYVAHDPHLKDEVQSGGRELVAVDSEDMLAHDAQQGRRLGQERQQHIGQHFNCLGLRILLLSYGCLRLLLGRLDWLGLKFADVALLQILHIGRGHKKISPS